MNTNTNRNHYNNQDEITQARAELAHKTEHYARRITALSTVAVAIMAFVIVGLAVLPISATVLMGLALCFVIVIGLVIVVAIDTIMRDSARMTDESLVRLYK